MSSDAAGFDIDVILRRGAREFAVRIPLANGITALTGPSGAGKSSALDAVAGLLSPLAGRIAVSGEVLFDHAAGIDLAPDQRHAGIVFQDLRLFPHMTVRANLLYGARRAPAPPPLDETCDLLGIAALLDRAPRTLSGGEAQRVAIGRALLSGARFLLMDEPLAALDAPRRAGILALIERLRDERGLPILYVSHQADEVARLASQVIEL